MSVPAYLFSICSAVYATLLVLIAVQARQKANAILASCCGVTAIWAAVGAVSGFQQLAGPAGFLDLLRPLAWYVYLLYLYKKSGTASAWQVRGFSAVAAIVLTAGLVIAVTADQSLSYTVYSGPIATRLLIFICELLLIENLFLNLPESARWHVAIPCILLGALACFDILVVTNTALFHKPSVALEDARLVAIIVVAPLLVLAAFRGQRWREPVRLSRAAVFHSATLVLSGSVMLSLALAGEILRHLDETWGWVAELSLVFCGLICVLLFVSSRSARSLMDRLVVHHFFADRYDYRTQWLSCIAALSGKSSVEHTDLHARAIRAVADVVNSPSGALYVRSAITGAMVWASSWNKPETSDLLSSHPLAQKLVHDPQVVELREVDQDVLENEPLSTLGPTWLAVPLIHAAKVTGVVVVGPPRMPFRLDQEVFDLLGILGQEVATHIAEQQATEAVVQTRNLHDYGKRFSFVAHDIKNVSSQLALLLSNAEHHLDNPEFQQDMLETVRASVHKIDRLLRRLDEPSAERAFAAISPVARLESLVGTYQHSRRVALNFEHDAPAARIEIGPEAFDAAVTHLLNNAVEAAPTRPVAIDVKVEGQRVAVDVTDQGPGMSPSFIRDTLFSPGKTSRPGGSGIGAFQARELITEAGGELLVTSQQGLGTTMRMQFARVEDRRPPPSENTLVGVVGEIGG